MADKLRAQAPWWVSAGLVLLGILQEYLRQAGEVRETTNGQAIDVLLEALRQCQS